MKVRISHIYVLTVCCLVAVAGSAALCQDGGLGPTGPEFGLDLTYVPTYIWRGLVANPDPAMQPSVTVSGYNGLSLNIWGSMDATDVGNNRRRFTEIDYTLDYSWARGPTGLSAGVIHYAFPNTGFDSTSELYLGASFDAPLSPSATVYYDFGEADGFYVSLGGSRSIEIPLGEDKSTTVDLSASFGYGSSNFNAFYFGTDRNAFTDLLLSAGVPFEVGDSATITPVLYYTSVLDGGLRDAVADPDNFFAGVTMSFAL